MKYQPKQEELGLEAVNFTNAIHQFREELEQVIEGTPVKDLISSSDRATLRKRGVLTCKRDPLSLVRAKTYYVPWTVRVLMERMKKR